jgi:uncharacterized membrane protein YeiH
LADTLPLSGLGPALVLFDYAELCLFALSGALAAAEKQQTPITFAFFATATGVGGGTIRDLIIGVPVFWVSDQLALMLCLIMSGIVWVTDIHRWPKRSMLWLDAVGLAAYAAVGAAKALSAGVGPLIAIVMGVFTAAMGGVIRDVLAHQPSIILGPEIYITAAAVAATAYVGLAMLGMPPILAGMIAASIGFGLRAAAMTGGWQLPHYTRTEGRPG